jgi:site-specific DNA recombinase
MRPQAPRPLRCAIYTRVSTEHGLEQEFNSLDNQREAAEAYVKSQAHEGLRALPARYDDGGFSGGSLDRPALQSLLTDSMREWQSRRWATFTVTVVPLISTISWLQSN